MRGTIVMNREDGTVKIMRRILVDGKKPDLSVVLTSNETVLFLDAFMPTDFYSSCSRQMWGPINEAYSVAIGRHTCVYTYALSFDEAVSTLRRRQETLTIGVSSDSLGQISWAEIQDPRDFTEVQVPEYNPDLDKYMSGVKPRAKLIV